MLTHNHCVICSAGFLLLLVGCGPSATPQAASKTAPTANTADAPQPSTPATVDPAAVAPADGNDPIAQTAAVPAKPASLVEATRVIDLRKFPLPDGGKDLITPQTLGGKDRSRSARALAVRLKRSDASQVAEFVRTKLGDAGWKLQDAPPSQDFFEFTGVKEGFYLSGSVYDNRAKGELSVSIENHGNLDSRALPRLSQAELKDNDAGRTIYLTNAKPDAVLEFMRAELQKSGWREVRDQTGTIDREPGFPVILRFVQRGLEITLSAEEKSGKTEVWNSVRLLEVELPIMPEAKGAVQFLGNSDLVHLFYAVPLSPEKVLEFYKNELPALGWSLRAGTDKIEDGKAKVILESPEHDPLRLELLADSQGTALLIAAASE